MRVRALFLAVFAWGMSLLPGSSARAQDVAPTSAAVQAAVDKGVGYLYLTQGPSHWEAAAQRQGNEHAVQALQGDAWGGATTMAVYALLSAGQVPAKNARLSEAVEFLKKADVVGVYALGMRAVVWSMLPQTPEVRDLLKRDVGLLVRSAKQRGAARGFHHYLVDAKSPEYDLSVSQFAVLGLWAATDAGVTVPQAYWQLADAQWRDEQLAGGGWAYNRNTGGSDSAESVTMTLAGIATLYVTRDLARNNAGTLCNGNVTDANIDRGLAVMERRFDEAIRGLPYGAWPNTYYSIYGIERVGVASGHKRFGQIDWYARLTGALLASQQEDGRWSMERAREYDVVNTAFAVAALSHGRAPVVMNKLKYGRPPGGGAATEARWNQRPRDVANVVRWVGRQAERSLNWQVVDLGQASASDLSDAPVLYVAGDAALVPTDDDAAKLKRYVDNGGLILANADCGSADFTTGFRKLGAHLFPTYEWRELPDQHPIYTRQQFARLKWKNRPSVLALGNGARELMILVPTADAGRAWQGRTEKGREELFQLASNVVLYAVDKTGLMTKGQTHIVTPDAGAPAVRTLRVARIQYDGNWDPEPGGWARLANVVRGLDQTALEVTAVSPGAATPVVGEVAHLTGTAEFRLSADARATIAKFVEAGDTLVVDAAGGSADFATSAEAELAVIFPGAGPPRPLAAGSSAYAGRDGKATPIRYRPFARSTLAGLTDVGRLRGIAVAGRQAAVVVSREDLSCGLVGQQVDGIVGYDPATATELVANILRGVVPAKP